MLIPGKLYRLTKNYECKTFVKIYKTTKYRNIDFELQDYYSRKTLYQNPIIFLDLKIVYINYHSTPLMSVWLLNSDFIILPDTNEDHLELC